MAAGNLDAQLRATGVQRIAGVDEVGRGAFAGPLVAAAVILPADDQLEGLDDSKRLTHDIRVQLATRIRAIAVAFAIVEVAADEIDRRGLHRANLWALREAAVRLAPAPDHLIVDGYAIAPTPFPSTAVRQADHVSRAVAAASILAKVARDTIMAALDQIHPGYGFAQHKGYGSSEHRAALDSLGLTPIHRRTFHGVGQPALWSTV